MKAHKIRAWFPTRDPRDVIEFDKDEGVFVFGCDGSEERVFDEDNEYEITITRIERRKK